jgi:hypothetical protein
MIRGQNGVTGKDNKEFPNQAITEVVRFKVLRT